MSNISVSAGNGKNRAVGAKGDVVLQVEDLNVSFPTEDGLVHAVRGVSYELRRGQSLGIVGESGSGKSVTSMAVMGLLPKTAQITGSAKFEGEELLGLGDPELSKIRGKKISMIFQDPLTSLNPVYTVGYQLAEAIRVHYPDVNKAEARKRCIDLLDSVGIPNPQQRVDAYPHELSGGMRQRVVIAIAMANNPDVIIADEPTTALDVTVQAQVLEALEKAREEVNAALILITHDLGVIAGHTDEVLVMYAGRPVEQGSVDEIFYEPRMPYTLGLIGSLPRMDEDRGHRLTPVHGTPPSMLNLPPGCPFRPRCPMSQDICAEVEPALLPINGSGHVAACHFQEQLEGKAPDDVFAADATDLSVEAEIEASEAEAVVNTEEDDK
ncbi:ABC transporter ATP-binding protein [Glycomyces sp. A-F 0318]|uniref:ABC transporter ATP-binding protein n=1 Tax=Glycomyces amatae TaxID=2881355 RepID=UPI001E4D109E|nr:ABC transporter ATP-binding protein [Glycomyces amatae]MCD0445612.1 ABC transporter ATP-binding protein [Glycomyces amatae]